MFSPMPRVKIRTRGAPEPITEASTSTAIVGLTLDSLRSGTQSLLRNVLIGGLLDSLQ
jgi:hypothetical protein